jgi:hypothetical protein
LFENRGGPRGEAKVKAWETEGVIECGRSGKAMKGGRREKVLVGVAVEAICPTWHAQEQRIEVDDS